MSSLFNEIMMYVIIGVFLLTLKVTNVLVNNAYTV